MSNIERAHTAVEQLRSTVTSKTNDALLGYPQDRTGVIERRPLQHEVVNFLADRLTSSSEVTGLDNLQKIRSLRLAGQRILLAPNHEAHMDAEAVTKSMMDSGFTDLADNLTFALGIRLERGTFSKFVVRSHNIIRIWPPTESGNTTEEKELKKLLDKQAPDDLASALDNSMIPVVFPQGTRAKEEREMLQARGSVIALFDHLDLDYVVPVTIDGTQNILPRGGRPQRGSYRVTYHEPKDYKELQDIHSDKKHKAYREAMMDAIMIPIARDLPEDRRGPYKDKI